MNAYNYALFIEFLFLIIARMSLMGSCWSTCIKSLTPSHSYIWRFVISFAKPPTTWTFIWVHCNAHINFQRKNIFQDLVSLISQSTQYTADSYLIVRLPLPFHDSTIEWSYFSSLNYSCSTFYRKIQVSNKCSLNSGKVFIYGS